MFFHLSALLLLLDVLIPAYLHGAVHDKEREVVMTILESLNNLLKDVKDPCVRGPEQLEKMCAVIKAVLENKVILLVTDSQSKTCFILKLIWLCLPRHHVRIQRVKMKRTSSRLVISIIVSSLYLYTT